MDILGACVNTGGVILIGSDVSTVGLGTDPIVLFHAGGVVADCNVKSGPHTVK